MKKLSIILLIIFCNLLLSCQKENELPLHSVDLKGKVQKGPFINGSSISIAVLDNDLNQTGSVYTTRIMDDLGNYEIDQMKVGKYIEITASGYYYNEVTGNLSSAPISLTQITDGSDSVFNVNPLTHLTSDRIKFLIKSGLDYKEAKQQAEYEMLKIFSYDSITIRNFSSLDISKRNAGDAILLSISSIFQNLRSEAQLTQLFADVINDFKVDGTLDDPELASTLLSSARYLDTGHISRNLQNVFGDLLTSDSLFNIEKYVMLFVNNTAFKSKPFFISTGDYGDNILSQKDGYIFKKSSIRNGAMLLGSHVYSYSFSAYVPADYPIRIKLTRLEGTEIWYYNSNYGWNITAYNEEESTQEFTPRIFDKKIDLSVVFGSTETRCKFKLELFEKDSATPLETKIFYWE